MRFSRDNAIFPVLVGKHILRCWRKNVFSSFGGKHTFFSFDGKTYFPVLAGKHNFQGLAGNMFWVSSGKHVFSFLSGNIFFGFWRDNMVSDSVRKHVFLWENMFFFLRKKCIFRFWRKNAYFKFSRDNMFLFFGGKMCFRVSERKRIFWFCGKTRFWI